MKRFLRIILIILISIFLVSFIDERFVSNEITDVEINEENEDSILENKYKSYDDVSILQYENGTIKGRLKLLSKQDKRINNILNNYNQYPEKLLEALSRNIELTTFVLNYNQKKNKVYSDNIGSLNEEVPELYQWDERWGYGKYGSSNLAISGCGPTALAMVASYLKKDNKITPYTVAKMAEEKGYYIEEAGTTWDLMTKGGASYGLKVKELPLLESSIFAALDKGHPVICSMRKGDFTINGHYIVLTKTVEGKIKVNDPYSKIRSSILWEYSRIKSQIKNLWEFSL